jgi:arylsulfatase A-like enzyme
VLVGVLAATELLLCRVTGKEVAVPDALAAVPFAGLLAVLLEGLRRMGRAGYAFGIGLIVTVYGLAILMPIAVGRTSWVIAPGLMVVCGLVFIVGPVLRSGGISHRVVTGVYAGYVIAAWLVLSLQVGLPAPAIWLPVVGVFALVMLLGPYAVLLSLAVFVPGTSGPLEPLGERVARGPDILLISIDTLRADAARRMRSYQWLGERGTPLAGQAPSPWTLPSVATLLTGADPHIHHAVRGERGYGSVASDVSTLAERLSEAGYDTALTAENPFTGAQFGLHRGFRRIDHESDRSWILPQALYSASPTPIGATLSSWLGLTERAAHGVAKRLDSARGFLQQRTAHPLFLWIHILDPHLPYTHAWGLDPHPLWRRAYLAHTNRTAIGEAPSVETLEMLKQAYAHEVDVVDAHLLRFLEQLPPAPNGRIIVMTSDHGEAFGEHGGWEHGHSMYQELLGVPLVIVGIDGLPRGAVVGLVDVAPTLLASAGIDASGLSGRVLQSEAQDGAGYGSVNPLYGDLDMRAARMGDRKLIAEGESVVEFDLSRDPEEAEPLDPSEVEVASWLPPIPEMKGGVTLSPETEEQLRSLGYLED